MNLRNVSSHRQLSVTASCVTSRPSLDYIIQLYEGSQLVKQSAELMLTIASGCAVLRRKRSAY